MPLFLSFVILVLSCVFLLKWSNYHPYSLLDVTSVNIVFANMSVKIIRQNVMPRYRQEVHFYVCTNFVQQQTAELYIGNFCSYFVTVPIQMCSEVCVVIQGNLSEFGTEPVAFYLRDFFSTIKENHIAFQLFLWY